jgi:hypothetical protein
MGKAIDGMFSGNTAVVGLVIIPPLSSISFRQTSQNGREAAINCGEAPLPLAYFSAAISASSPAAGT